MNFTNFTFILVSLLWSTIIISQSEIYNALSSPSNPEIGMSFDINEDATFLVVGMPATYASGTSGSIKVYKRNSLSFLTIASKSGNEIGGRYGMDVAISGNAEKIVIGHPYSSYNSYDSPGSICPISYNNTSGNFSYGGCKFGIADTKIGSKVAISNNGQRMAGSGPYYLGGRVKVIQSTGSSLDSNDDIYSEYNWERFGNDIALNSNGDILVVGSEKYDNFNFGWHIGGVKTYEWNVDEWIQKGNTVVGLDSAENLGASVTVNSAGNILGIGSPGFNSNKGRVQIYEWLNSDWTLKGNEITSNIPNDFFGYEISMDGTGNIVAVSSKSPENNEQGKVQIFQWNGSDWLHVGSTLYGDNVNNSFGHKLKLTKDGSVLAVGSPGKDLFEDFGGSIRFYGLTGVTSAAENENFYSFQISPNPANDDVKISFNMQISDLKINIYDISGYLEKSMSYDYSVKEISLELNLKSGVYFIETIQNEKYIGTKKIIVN